MFVAVAFVETAYKYIQIIFSVNEVAECVAVGRASPYLARLASPALLQSYADPLLPQEPSWFLGLLLLGTPADSEIVVTLCSRRSTRMSSTPAAAPLCMGSPGAVDAGWLIAAAAWRAARRGAGDPWRAGTRWRRRTGAGPRCDAVGG